MGLNFSGLTLMKGFSKIFSLIIFLSLQLIPIFATASPKQPAPENPPGWERSKGNWS